MIRLIAKVGDKWAMDFEWGFLKPATEPEEEDLEHDSDLSSDTERAPETDWIPEDSEVPKAHKIVGFVPNKEENKNG